MACVSSIRACYHALLGYTIPRGAHGTGPTDGAQPALGRGDGLHVAWLQSEPPSHTRCRADGPGLSRRDGR